MATGCNRAICREETHFTDSIQGLLQKAVSSHMKYQISVVVMRLSTSMPLMPIDARLDRDPFYVIATQTMAACAARQDDIQESQKRSPPIANAT